MHSFSAGLLVARAAGMAAGRGSWLIAAAVGGAGVTGALTGAAVFALGCASVCMLAEPEADEKLRKLPPILAAALYAAASALQCAGTARLCAKPHLCMAACAAECALVAAAAFTVCGCSAGGAVLRGLAAGVLSAVLSRAVAFCGLPPDGKLAAILIELSSAALAGAALSRREECTVPSAEAAGMGCAAALAALTVLG